MTRRRVEGPRLVYYMTAANADFWATHWSARLSPDAYRSAEEGSLGRFERLFTRYLPRRGRILEAGCGLGQYVLALRARGYEAEGIEWAARTVEAVRSIHPLLPIHRGDVARLKARDGLYDGYISLGVMEHRQEGPQAYLHEAYRVLAPGGIALVSVPYFHPLRRMKARLRLYGSRTDGLAFYQYAFREKEFLDFLQQAGFQVIDKMLYDGLKGLKDEIPLLRKVMNWPGLGWRLRRWLRNQKWLDRHFGHMILFVCRKSDG